jgi:hypothetical protein
MPRPSSILGLAFLVPLACGGPGGKPKPRKLIEYAKVCRVENVMRPYLEALL